MKNISTAFHELWSGFYNRSSLLPDPVLIPAYQSGYAISRDSQGRPVAPPFPYITYEIVRPSFSDFTIATANIWDKDPQNPGFFGLVDDVLAQAAEKIPEEGIILDVGADGTIAIYRSNPFIDYLDDPDDQAITR
ncbi:MAG: hypothetical protein FWD23_16135, partial [Oscillospiraceae bacterium]|nr:hypothetical protein [Oscillospiraceae bacterium]